MLTRRKLMKLSAAVIAGSSLGCGSDSASELSDAGGGLDAAREPDPFSRTLPIPDRLDGPNFDLRMASGSMQFFPEVTTETKGYNGNYLGPTLFLRAGMSATFRVQNDLDKETTTHWHGQHLPAAQDGGPYQKIASGETWVSQYEIRNGAGTYWYHPHHHPMGSPPLGPDGTGGQVYDGLAGMFIIEDELSDSLDLPRTYGVDDIPVILQDRRFHPDGRFMHFPDDFNGQTDPALRKGGEFLVNGMIGAVLEVGAQVIRLRILNASNVRIYNLGLGDNSEFYQIVSDGGFLNAPISMTRLLIAPGERAEILIDLQGRSGDSITLRSFNADNGRAYVPRPLADDWDTSDFDLMSIEVTASTENPTTTIPGQLANFSRMTEADATNASDPRPFLLEVNPFTINGVKMDMNVINERIRMGDVEIWELSNPNMQAHPFHVHGEPFQILSRNGALPPPNERGWKDVVLIRPDEVVRIIKRFDDFSDSSVPYMYHCHILEHEDVGMMGTFTVEDI